MPIGVALDLIVGAVAQAGEVEHLFDALRRHRSAGGSQFTEVGAGREVRIEGRRFDKRSHLEQATSIAALERLAEQLDHAAVGVDQPGQDSHGRRLAGAVGPEEAVHDARRYRQVEAVEGVPRPVALAQATGRKGEAVRAAHAGPPPASRAGFVGGVPESK